LFSGADGLKDRKLGSAPKAFEIFSALLRSIIVASSNAPRSFPG
jgi:hypothetical protein